MRMIVRFFRLAGMAFALHAGCVAYAPAAWAAEAAPAVRVTASPASIAPGDTFRLTAQSGDAAADKARAALPRAVALYRAGEKASLKAYLEPVGKDTYRALGTLPPGEYRVGYVWLSEMPRAGVTPRRTEATTRLAVRPALTVSVQPDPAQGYDLRLTLKNDANRTVTATATVDMIGSRTDTISNIVLAPGETTVLPITNAVPENRPLTAPLPVVAQVNAGTTMATWSGNVYFWSAGKTWGAPLTLGSAQEWQGEDGAWAGPDDLSATVQARYDEHNLYLRAEVTDDVFTPPGADLEAERGDSIRVAVDPHWSRRVDAPKALVFTLALTADGPKAFRGVSGSEPAPGAALTVARAEARTQYEAFIPWSELGVTNVRPSRTLGFSLLVNDDDGEGHKGGLAYGDGIAGDNRPDRYAALTLLPAAP